MFLFKVDTLERSLYLNNVPIELRTIIRFYVFNKLDPRFLKDDNKYCSPFFFQTYFNKSVLNNVKKCNLFIQNYNYNNSIYFIAKLPYAIHEFVYDFNIYRITNVNIISILNAKEFMDIIDDFGICYQIYKTCFFAN